MRRKSGCGTEERTITFIFLQDKFRTRVAANHLGVVQCLEPDKASLGKK